jgi:hypothetical protein
MIDSFPEADARVPNRNRKYDPNSSRAKSKSSIEAHYFISITNALDKSTTLKNYM